MARDRLSVGLGWPAASSQPDGLIVRPRSLLSPELPGLPPDQPWRGQAGWTPLGTIELVRHRRLRDGRYRHTNSRAEPRGHVLDHVVGSVQRDPQPSTRRLSAAGDHLHTGASEDQVPEGQVLLGHVEQLPYILLLPLELRTVPGTGQQVLVGGDRDPLRRETTLESRIGWIEGSPIEPLALTEHLGTWGVGTLVRRLDRGLRRHVYDVVDEPVDRAFRLGGVWTGPAAARGGLVRLERDAAGRVRSATTGSRPPTPSPAERLRWAGAPVRWSGRRTAGRAVAARAVRLLRPPGPGVSAPPSPLGHVPQAPAAGWSPLFSATHPVVGDQFLTRSPIEATDLGYVVDGVLGHVADRWADGGPAPGDIPWASRFGRGRRYREPD